jgi:prepilin peptidase CpaA
MQNSQFIQYVIAMVLIYVAIEDILKFKIRNESVVILIVLFVIAAMAPGALWPAFWHVVFGLVMFAVMLAIYALGVIGGGDAKLLTVAFLWMGWENTSLFCILLALAAATYYMLHRFGHILPGKPGANGKTMIPYGPCIAAAWIGTMALQMSA